MQRKVPESVGACFALIEREMLKGPWVMGERYTICDPYLFTLAQWLEGDGVDLADFPKVVDHRAHVGAARREEGDGGAGVSFSLSSFRRTPEGEFCATFSAVVARLDRAIQYSRGGCA